MTRRFVAIRLKVPDNTAYTALVALQRLGVDVGQVERATIVPVGDGDDAAVLERVRRDESLFNPNLHEVEIRNTLEPEPGEMVVREVPGSDDMSFPRRRSHIRASRARDDKVEGRARVRPAKRATQTSWKLFDRDGHPVSKATLGLARDVLLCNPAIEEAEMPCDGGELPA